MGNKVGAKIVWIVAVCCSSVVGLVGDLLTDYVAPIGSRLQKFSALRHFQLIWKGISTHTSIVISSIITTVIIIIIISSSSRSNSSSSSGSGSSSNSSSSR